jgi:hypothetical protein
MWPIVGKVVKHRKGGKRRSQSIDREPFHHPVTVSGYNWKEARSGKGKDG